MLAMAPRKTEFRGADLRDELTARSCSRAEFARAIGISDNAAKALILGVSRPKATTRARIDAWLAQVCPCCGAQRPWKCPPKKK